MLPLLPNSAYTRDKEFVKEEWDAMFASGASAPADKVEGGWKGVLYSNLALIDPKASWDFFAADNFDLQFIDGGASRIWYLTYAASKCMPISSYHKMVANCIFQALVEDHSRHFFSFLTTQNI